MDSKTQHTSWTVDECPDERGFSVIRPHDGTPNGNTDEHPIATVYAPEHARLIAAAPAMYDFIASRAKSGDHEASKILEAIHGNR